ncbi:MAG TPA: HEAT repeat domain-containing protein [Pirellulales bacterium]|jgi:HEAT repeat protein|nr:HEAT repeat domain-containing protein [Pirellulales bacterium]
MKRIFAALIAGAALAASGSILIDARAARADIFVLTSDGQIQGEAVNSPDTPKDKTVIRTLAGGEITLEKKQIRQIIPQSAAELEYEKIRPTYPDTVEGQWQLAEWCRDHSLSKQRQVHLERVIALDAGHKQARAVLGYSMIDGHWIRRDDLMKERGYVLYKGKWELPQQVEIDEQRRKEDAAQRDWFATLKRWRARLDADELHEKLLATTDPTAIPAISLMLKNEPVQKIKIYLIESLIHLGTTGALKTAVSLTLDDPDEEVRWSALDLLAATKHPELTSIYIGALRSSDNTRVNRAAYCLGKLGDKSAVLALIDALQTRHKTVEGNGPPGQMSTTFGSGPGGSIGGLSINGGTQKEIKVWLQNPEVLKALDALTNADFQYNQAAWKSWYASQKKPVNVDARRGE